MLERAIYISGIHASGKSSLIKDLLEHEEFVQYETYLKVDLEHTYHRGVFRLARYWIEAHEIQKLAEENSGKLILVDRCIYDNTAYCKGFHSLGWMSDEELQHHESCVDVMFREFERPKNIVHVAPSSSWVEERLKDRWETTPLKWREDNLEYMNRVLETFSKIYAEMKGVNILRLEETDRKKRVENVFEWIKNSSL